MIVEKGRFAVIDTGKLTWEMAVITRSGRMKKTAFGDREPEEKTGFAKGDTTAEGRMKLYKSRDRRTRYVLRRGNLAFITAKEIEKAVGIAQFERSPNLKLDGNAYKVKYELNKASMLEYLNNLRKETVQTGTANLKSKSLRGKSCP
jgi:hypothetical protein